MSKLLCRFSVFCLTISTSLATAASLSLPAEESLISVSIHPTWKHLLGYNKNNQSQVIDENFFLHKSGNTDSHFELIATLKSFAETETIGDAHPQCQHRARYIWLREQFSEYFSKLHSAKCPSFESFSNYGDFYSVSLILATGYLGNPASYYGHLLFKINSATKETTDLENVAVNYGARIPPEDNAIEYIFKGISGFYESRYTHRDFYYFVHKHSDSEKRDLWEYELDLTQNQYELLIAYAWEMQNRQHKYYFLNKNCAYRFAELIELITKDGVNQNRHPWVAPQSILQNLANLEFEGKSIIRSIKYHPSKQSQLYRKFTSLNTEEKQWVRIIIEEPKRIYSNDFDRVNKDEAFKITDALIDYYRYRFSSEELENHSGYLKVISKRMSLPISEKTYEYSSSFNPHLGHRPSYTSAGYFSSDQRDGIKLRLRPAYYDPLDASYGHVSNSTLSMLDISLNLYDDALLIDYIDFIKIENLNSKATRLPGDTPNIWSLRVGIESKEECKSCLGFVLDFNKGLNMGLLRDTLNVSLLAGAGFKGDEFSIDSVNLHIKPIVTYKASEKYSALFESNLRKFTSEDETLEHKFSFRYSVSENIDLRLTRTQDQTYHETNITLGVYW